MAIKEGKLKNFQKDLKDQLDVYANFDYKGDALKFSKIKALILDLIHNIDVVDQLLKDKVIMQTKNTSDWIWYKQLKYYVDQTS
jgi:dynein heavy chain 2